MKRQATRVGAILLGVSIAVSPTVSQPTAAASALTVTPITWDIVGLDSNNPATGPNRFPVGARVCASGGTVTGVMASWSWDSANGNINLRPGSLSNLDLGTLSAGECADAYFEVEVTRTPAAYDTTRRYHITASGPGVTGSTPQPRQLYVEHLISQNRNGVLSVALDGNPIPAGGTMTLVEGRTYDIKLDGYTATQGYNQLEAFIGLPNTVFQILSVGTTFSADTSPFVATPNDRLYADACGWDSDPNSPNYRSCIGGDGKAGGTVSTTYHVRIIGGSGTSETLGSLLYDFSGSSYHYNADFGVGARIASIVSPASIAITKTFNPRVITPGGTSTLTVKVTNPTPETIEGIAWADALPAGMKVAGTPAVSYSGCGTGAFSPVPVADATSLTFAAGTVAPGGTCTATVKVTAPAGTYENTTGHLFIDTDVDTGNTGSDTLTAVAAAACTPNQTLASWTIPNGTTANPPDLAGGLPTTRSTAVSTATAAAAIPANSSIWATAGSGDSTSWSTHGYKNAGQQANFVVDTRKFSAVSMGFDLASDSNGPTQVIVQTSTGGAFTTRLTINLPATAFAQHTLDLAGLTSTTGNTTFRIAGTGALNDQSGANMYLDNIRFSGCLAAPPAPTLVKSFAPDPIVKGDTTTLTFTLTNTAVGNEALSGVAFSDVLPGGLEVATGSVSACGGTVTTTGATRTIALTGGTVAAGGSCTFDVTVTGAAEGGYDNLTGFVSTTQGGTTTAYATDSLTVVAPPELAKEFIASSIVKDRTSVLLFTITNPNGGTALTGIDFTDSLPAGVIVADDGPRAICGGTGTSTAPSTIELAGASLAAGARCSFGVPVMGATAGLKVNTTGTITSTEGGGGGTATATLEVTDPVAKLELTKQVATSPAGPWRTFTGVAEGASVYYRFALYNAGDVTFSSTDVADPDVAGCTWSGDPNPSLAPGDTAYCTSDAVTAVVGLHINTATASGTSILGDTTSEPSSASYGTTELTLAKTATDSWFVGGTMIDYTFVVTNSGDAPLLGPVSIDDDLTTDESCRAVSTVGDHDGYLDPGEAITCTATYTATADDVTARHVTNTATATADGVTSATDSATVDYAHLAIDKSATESWFNAAGDTLHYSFLVTNDGAAALAGPVVVSDDKASDESCPALATVGDLDAVLDPGESVTCTASYAVAAADVTTKSVTNTASATAGGISSGTDQVTIPLARLSITKSSTTTSIDHAGQVVPYVITVTNTGGMTLTGLALDDALCTPTRISGDTGNDDVFAAGESWVYACSHTVTQAEVDAGATLTNTATADTTQTTPQDGTKDIGVTRSPELTLEKSATQAWFNAAGDAIDYAYRVTNIGNVTLNGPVTVSDDTVAVTCPPVVTLAPGASVTCAATYATDAADVTAKHVTNIASASATGPSGMVTSPDDTVTVPLAALTITKAADPITISSPGDITYTITLVNTGAVGLANVTVGDALTGGVGPVSGDTNANDILDTTETWVYTASFTATQGVIDAGGDIVNTATVTTDKTAIKEAQASTHVATGPDITVDKATIVAAVDAAGDVITYTITVTNTGNVTLTGVDVADDLAGTATYVAGDTNDNDKLDVDETWIYEASYVVTQPDMDAGDDLVNTATVTTDQTSPATDSATTRVDQRPDVSITKVADPVTIAAPGAIDYAIGVENTGNVTLTGIDVADLLTGDPVLNSGDTDHDGDLDVGETWRYSARYTVTQADIDAGDAIVNRVLVTTDQDVSDSADATTTVLRDPAMSIVKTSTTTSITVAGQVVPYRLEVANTGNTTLTGVTVSDPACDAAPEYASGDEGSPATLDPGESWVYTCSRTVTQGEVDAGGNLSNTATADSTETRSVDDTLAILVAQRPALSLAKSITRGYYFVKAGNVIEYEYRVTNSGNVTIDGPITVEDDKTAVQCPTVSSLAPGAAFTCTSRYTVTKADVAAGKVTNHAVARGSVGEVIVESSVAVAAATRFIPPTAAPTSAIETAVKTVPGGWSGVVLLVLVTVGLLAFVVTGRRAGRRRTR